MLRCEQSAQSTDFDRMDCASRRLVSRVCLRLLLQQRQGQLIQPGEALHFMVQLAGAWHLQDCGTLSSGHKAAGMCTRLEPVVRTCACFCRSGRDSWSSQERRCISPRAKRLCACWMRLRAKQAAAVSADVSVESSPPYKGLAAAESQMAWSRALQGAQLGRSEPKSSLECCKALCSSRPSL